MRRAFTLFCLLLPACNAPHGPDREFRSARALIDRTVAEYPDIVRLTIHAVPTGQTRNRIVACNIEERVGKASDPEDLEAMQTRSVTVLREGSYLDITVPILDKSGKAIAATGITFKCPDGASEQVLVNQAKSIAREMSKEIQNAGHPMW